MGFLRRISGGFFFLVLALLATAASAQSSLLDDYIEEGIRSNLALKQKLTSYEQSLQELREARGLFFPHVSLNARYTAAQGGRTIPFEVGDLLNPAYSTLNALSAIHGLVDPNTGQPIHFPELENQEFYFYRPFEHETKLELIQPIFSTSIYYNHRIKQNLIQAKRADAEAYKRQLVAEIKTAYFNYLKSMGLLRLVESTRELLEENIRVNERLFHNNLVTVDYVYRSRAEMAKLEQHQAEATRMERIAAAYLNFLINRPLTSPVRVEDVHTMEGIDRQLEVDIDTALLVREELSIVQEYSQATQNAYKLHTSSRLPSVFAVVNYGFQGERYRFTGDDDFMLASVVLRWDIFAGMQNNARIQQARLEQLRVEQQRAELEEVIRMDVINAWYALQAAYKSIDAARMQAETTEKAFHVVSRKHSEGQVSLIEYIDARTAMTTAQENLIVTGYDYMIMYAEYERAAGLYPISELKTEINTDE